MSQIIIDSSGDIPSLSLPPIKMINSSMLGFSLSAWSTTSKWPAVGGLKELEEVGYEVFMLYVYYHLNLFIG